MFPYKTCLRNERIGRFELAIESLEDIDRTIDDLFARLEAEGNPSLLESLCPYFGIVWPSGRALAEELAALPSLTGKRVLELGCGLALPAIVAAKLGAEVTATDFHPDIMTFLAGNVSRNLPSPEAERLKFRELDWIGQSAELGKYDWVIGSDILYERHQARPVARIIHDHLAPGGTAVVTDPGRPYLQDFSDEMKRLGHEYRLRTRNNIFVLVFGS